MRGLAAQQRGPRCTLEAYRENRVAKTAQVREEREKADAALEEMTVSYAQAEAALVAHHKAMDEPYNPADDQSVNLQDLGAPEVKK